MKIKYEDKGRTEVSFKDLFYIGKSKASQADYRFTIIIFGYEWSWLIYKNQESVFEYQQIEYDRDARYAKWEHDNDLEEGRAI